MLRSRVLLSGVLLAAGACVGNIGDAPGTGSAALACKDGARFDPGPTYLRRLTNAEYRATIAMLFGAGLTDVTVDFPPDPIARGYSNNSEAISISDLHVERYAQAAERIAFEVLGDGARRDALVGCDPASEAGCVESFVDRFGRLAFRRPLSEEERAAFLALASEAGGDPDPYAAVQLVIEAALQSSSFLFRVEQGTGAGEDGLVQLSGYELATRLSFLLLGRAPDAALLDAAARGELDDTSGLARWAAALFDSEEGGAARERFASEWLQLGLLDSAAPNHPLWSEELVASMREESRRFVADLMEDGDMLDLLDARHGFVDAALAEVYGLSPPAADFERIAFGPDTPRAGILTQASILTLTAKNAAATVIRRGKYVRDVLLCDPPPPPPPDVPPLAGEEGSVEEQLSAHLSDPVCISCHERLDPIGFGFARYDAVGSYHERDDAGGLIDQSGRVVGLEPEAFDGPIELAARLRAAEEVPACMVTQAFRHAFGRGEIDADACTLDDLVARFSDGGRSFRELVLAFVQSPAFRYRSARDAEEY